MPQSGKAELFTGALLLQFFYYLFVLGESSCFELGINNIAVRYNVEDAPASGNQIGVYSQHLLQFIRQTGGFRFVVSLHAIANFKFHRLPPFHSIRNGRP